MDSLLQHQGLGPAVTCTCIFLWKYILIFKKKQCLATVKKGEKDRKSSFIYKNN